ncbi:hypothetical protein EVG20_g9558, partial [Dentipellis fragilis]
MSTPISPSDDELKSTLIALKTENPTLGIPKLHALLLAQNTTWTVSEKRVKKTLQAAGLVVQPPAAKKIGKGAAGDMYPSSELIQNLDVTKWSSKIEVKYFGKNKGKGLVAKEPIAEGEVIWKEDPFIVAPEWHVPPFGHLRLAAVLARLRFLHDTTKRVLTGRAMPCLDVCRLLPRALLLAALPFPQRPHTPASLSRPEPCIRASARLCAARRMDGTARRRTLRRAAAARRSGAAGGGLGHHTDPRAQVRGRAGPRDVGEGAPAARAGVQAPARPEQQKKLARILNRAPPPDVAAAFFTYDGFLRSLGRMSLNLEAHGGLYTLHSHLNHACTPTVSVRHLDPRTALARISLLAKRAFAPGDELLVTYVDPSLGLRARRKELGAWGFGVCR